MHGAAPVATRNVVAATWRGTGPGGALYPRRSKARASAARGHVVHVTEVPAGTAPGCGSATTNRTVQSGGRRSTRKTGGASRPPTKANARIAPLRSLEPAVGPYLHRSPACSGARTSTGRNRETDHKKTREFRENSLELHDSKLPPADVTVVHYMTQFVASSEVATAPGSNSTRAATGVRARYGYRAFGSTARGQDARYPQDRTARLARTHSHPQSRVFEALHIPAPERQRGPSPRRPVARVECNERVRCRRGA